ncbi:MAG: cyclic nucleotide-binding domain-containing protein [Candidatus Stahlbacteria bacterium]|nr:MAG: cyclic nucleotide-binding domain-containing protein [Candidatus Stahlbacteria bacterium]
MRSKTLRFKVGDVMFSEGDISKEMFSIREGRVRIKKKGKWVADLKVGDFVREMGVLDRQVRSATAEAIENTVVSALDVDVFHEKLEQEPMIGLLIKTLIRRIREIGRRLYKR